jgi:hypothetical protein
MLHFSKYMSRDLAIFQIPKIPLFKHAANMERRLLDKGSTTRVSSPKSLPGRRLNTLDPNLQAPLDTTLVSPRPLSICDSSFISSIDGLKTHPVARPIVPRTSKKLNRPNPGWKAAFIEKQKTPPSNPSAIPTTKPEVPAYQAQKKPQRVYAWHGHGNRWIDENGVEVGREEAMKFKSSMKKLSRNLKAQAKRENIREEKCIKIGEFRDIKSKRPKRNVVVHPNSVLEETLKTRNRWGMSKSACQGGRSDYEAESREESHGLKWALKLEERCNRFDQEYQIAVDAVLKARS